MSKASINNIHHVPLTWRTSTPTRSSRRFLKATSRDGFGDNLFRDWRYNSDNTPKKDFILNNLPTTEKFSWRQELRLRIEPRTRRLGHQRRRIRRRGQQLLRRYL